MELEFNFQSQPQTAAVEYRENPLRILVLGDFSGRDNREAYDVEGLADRPVVAVDVDNVEDLLYRFAPRLHLPIVAGDGPGIAVEFKNLDDFHPDELYRRLSLFQGLRDRRKRLQDPATFEEAAAELRSRAQAKPRAEMPEAPAEKDADTLERLLGSKPAEAPHRRVEVAAEAEVEKLIADVVAPYIVPETDPRQAEYVASVDRAIGEQMRGLLHHPTFQSLEAAWRSLKWLVSEVETSENLKIYLLDVSKHEIFQDLLAAGGNLEQTGLFKLLVDKHVKTAGGAPWSVLVGNFTFGTGTEDAKMLAFLGALGAQSGGPFLAGAHPQTIGCRSLLEQTSPNDWDREVAGPDEPWTALRKSGFAHWVGLALPRVLLRLPYGKATEEIDHFEFEEMPNIEPGTFLWGNPAFALAILIGQAFAESGWSMQMGNQLGDLPSYIYEEDGERKQYPCGEAYLSDRAGEAILERGIMPILSNKTYNSIAVLRVQSLADPPAGLAGNVG